MNFLDHDLGSLKRGDVVVVTLTQGANVRLLDSSNFQRYQRGERHEYHGGLAKRSPVRLAVPRGGRWHLVVDMQGLRGSTRAGVQVVQREALEPLPPIREQRADLAAIAANLAELGGDGAAPDERDFDVFISHATEDKDVLVRPLAHSLQEEGLRVWYDEFELRVGDSLRRRIDHGISRSRFGIVVLSKHFFAKSWPEYELDGLVTMANSGRQVILPLWHEVSKDEVISYSPSLADRVALRTADASVAEIAEEVAAVVRDI